MMSIKCVNWLRIPDWESSVSGPFDRWPTGMGFDYFYGFIGAPRGEQIAKLPVLLGAAGNPEFDFPEGGG